ncbi:uncharacterized protein LOC142985764 [Anticarsia gemmatalis]|uniref:uncharacterized protein LOC142985764 n=1 Tax=Anticarsia gemmatalis TaxID=129554 RepID=UPI003F7639B4
MKSKTVEIKPNVGEKFKMESFNFIGFYKTAAESNKVLGKDKADATPNKSDLNDKVRTPKREHSPYNKNKKKSKQEPCIISQINIDASSLNSGVGARAQLNDSKVTSTPNASSKNTSGVKSIMKNTSLADQSIDSARSNPPSGKSKKRNKSVSFMLDDHEEVVVKRTKSDDTIKVTKKTESTRPNVKDKKKPAQKFKNSQQSEKENKATNHNKQNKDVETQPSPQEKKPTKATRASKVEPAAAPVVSDSETLAPEKKKKFKKVKKQKAESKPESMETESNNNEVTTEAKSKKPKKKKQTKRTSNDKNGTGEGDGEPVSKSRKKETKPDIAEDLENLTIGDNPHTLTNLLDEMTVVDKDKKKSLRKQFNKNKKPKGPNKEEAETSEEVKEKVKWKKRKWNKDKKGDVDEDSLANTVVIENLPLAIMLNYKNLLAEHFNKYGLIKKIGIAEVYPTEESKPVFTTTITFYSDGAANQAMELNNTEFEGSRIRMKHALPPTATTIVLRSYAELTDQNISSMFLGAGKIRSIRHLVKGGKKSMGTAFIEFDGPESVEQALKMAAGAKISGKKTHVAKFEVRSKKKHAKAKSNSDSESAGADTGTSDDSD